MRPRRACSLRFPGMFGKCVRLCQSVCVRVRRHVQACLHVSAAVRVVRCDGVRWVKRRSRHAACSCRKGVECDTVSQFANRGGPVGAHRGRPHRSDGVNQRSISTGRRWEVISIEATITAEKKRTKKKRGGTKGDQRPPTRNRDSRETNQREPKPVNIYFRKAHKHKR